MSFAIFDLDQTLLPYDTQVLFCNYVLRRHPLRRAYLALFGPAVMLRAVGIISTRTLKRVFLSYLRGLTEKQIAELVDSFVEAEVVPRLYPELMAEVARHKAAERTLILNTASPIFYAAAIGERLGFDHTFGTPVRLKDIGQPFFPRIDGANNKYDVKLKAMRHLMPVELTLPLPGSWAYSDSKADLPLLRFVESPVTVHPDPFLAAIAAEEAWPVLTPARPNPTRAAYRRDCALQALGLFPRRKG
ncbi:MAG: haloacid dehalogenase-like hydrolase [Verrucomicrobiales bacterium]|nr:haloacid dehalogenase-like hydrolase [Verrucomicrobiales bacterium]